jgi:hypothetical protein
LDLCGRRQLCRPAVFVGVNSSFVRESSSESFQACRMRSLLAHQLLHPSCVHRAPCAGGSPRRETNLVTPRIDRLADTVDPSEAERFIDRFRPGNRRLTGTFSIETDPLFGALVVIFLKPNPKLLRLGKENRLLVGRFQWDYKPLGQSASWWVDSGQTKTVSV